MSNPAPLGLRGVRAGVLGACALLLAATAHLLAGGSLPSLPMLLVVGIPIGCAAVVAARRIRGVPSLLAFLTLCQLALHEAFMSSAASMPCAPGTAHAGHGAHAIAPTGCTTAMPMPHIAAPSTVMLALHAVAVVATALLLAHGERVALRLWLWLQPRARVRVVGLPALAPAGSAFRVPQAAPAPLLASDVSRRGPPRRGAPLLSFA